MAKEQNLSLNQTKISGVCGRLMCCLKNEQETYEELNRNLPGIGDIVTTPQGITGTVQSVNVLRQMVKIVVDVNDEKEIQEFPVRDLKFRPKKKKGKGGAGSADHDEKEAKREIQNRMRSDLVKCGERVDDLQNGLFVIQDPKKFCFGMDAVLLSGFARVKKGEVALDMGTGTGIIPILLSDRTDGEHFTGLEIQHECAEMADRSVRYNGLEDRVRIVEGDIKEAAGIFGAASFDVVTCNPPYMIGQHGLTNPHVPKAIARHEILCTFDDVACQAARVLKDRGRFFWCTGLSDWWS